MKIAGGSLLIAGILLGLFAFLCMDYNPKTDSGPDIPWLSGEAALDVKEIMKEDKAERIEAAGISMYIISCVLVVSGGILFVIGKIKEKKNPEKIAYKCNNCGVYVAEDQEFCSKCGNRLFYRCQNCNEIYEAETFVCSKCGTQIK